MIKRILLILLLFMLLALLGVWLIQGGVQKVKNAAHVISDPVGLLFGTGSSTGLSIQLPWQVAIPQGPDISEYTSQGSETSSGDSNQKETYAELATQYDTIQTQVRDAKTFGTPSPYRGKVQIQGTGGAGESDPRMEYVELHANSANTAPVIVRGWSLQSAVSGVRAFIPPAASMFYMGVVNPVQDVSLDPDARIIINTGISPVGVSFRENMCTGYLQQFQNFSPDLSRVCPDTADALPITAENLQRYGDACPDFVASLPRCTFPDTALPSDLSFACKSFIVNTLSYNGCANMYVYKPSFFIDLWRIYLGYGRELWRNTHDVIRLLDDSGRTVDVLTY